MFLQARVPKNSGSKTHFKWPPSEVLPRFEAARHMVFPGGINKFAPFCRWDTLLQA